MAPDGPAVDRLREYLRQLPPGARTLLIKELERARLRGDEIPGGEILLQEVRSAVRGTHDGAPRIGAAERLFFRPLEPFLCDDDPSHKHRGCIARASLETIWGWIRRDVLPNEAKSYSEQANRALGADASDRAEQLARAFQDKVAERIQAMLASGRSDERAMWRMAGQVGTPNALDDVGDLAAILRARDGLAALDNRLPGQISHFADAQLEGARAMLDSPLGPRAEGLLYGLILVKGRLACPWQLIRIAIKAADSDDATRIAATPYAAAVTVVLDDVAGMVRALRASLKRGANNTATTLLKSIHDAARGLRTELDLQADSPWGRQLTAIRVEISSLLKTQIESLPGCVRRLLRPRPASEMAIGNLDAGEVAETEALLEFGGLCRNFAGELAISETALRTFNELQLYLDTSTQGLLDGLRNSTAADRSFRQSQVDAAVRFCAKVFGREYASLLIKAAEVAANSERKAAARA